MESIINKEYAPLDNSYSYNISTCKHESLAPNCYHRGTLTIIKSEPFKVKVKFMDTYKEHEFILVETGEGETHCILYFPFRVINDDNRNKLLHDLDTIKVSYFYF